MSEADDRYILEKDKNFQLKLSLKDRVIEDLTDKLTNADRQLKRLAFERQEFEDAMNRKLRLLDEENSLLRYKFEEVMVAFDKSVSVTDDSDKYRSVELRYTQAMDLAKVTGNRLEETEFNVEQLKLTVDSLRKEILSLNDLLKATRETSCHLEMQLVDCKDKLSTTTMQLKSTRSLQSKSDSEVLQALDTIKQLETSLMAEKKRCVEIERLKDEAVFSAHNTERSLSDQLKTMKVKYDRLAVEFESWQKGAGATNDKLRTALATEVENMKTMAKRFKISENEVRDRDAEIYRLKHQLEVANSRRSIAGRNSEYEQKAKFSDNTMRLKDGLTSLKDDLLHVRKDIAKDYQLHAKSMIDDLRRYAKFMMLRMNPKTTTSSSGENRRSSSKTSRQTTQVVKRDQGFYDESQAKPNINSFDKFDIRMYPMNSSNSSGKKKQLRYDDISTPAKKTAYDNYADRTISKTSASSITQQRYDLQAIEMESEAISKRIAMLKANKY